MEVCQICGAKMEIVSDYHCATHNMTRDEYREKHGRKYDTNFKIYPRMSLADREYIGYYVDTVNKRQRRKTKWKLK